MGFSFPVSLHEITANQLSSLDEHLQSLKDETKAIASDFKNPSPIRFEVKLDKIAFLMKRYTAIIFGATMDSNGKAELIIKASKEIVDTTVDREPVEKSDTIMKLLNDTLGPFEYSWHILGKCTSYYSQMLKYKEVKFSPLGESIIMLMEGYIENIARQSLSDKSYEHNMHSILNHGFNILNTVHLWIHQEIHLIPETISYVHKKTEFIVKDKIVSKSRNSKLEKNKITHEIIVNKFKVLRNKNPKITKDAASRELENEKDIPFSARVIAKHLSKV